MQGPNEVVKSKSSDSTLESELFFGDKIHRKIAFSAPLFMIQ
jgi:hypothetical protein